MRKVLVFGGCESGKSALIRSMQSENIEPIFIDPISMKNITDIVGEKFIRKDRPTFKCRLPMSEQNLNEIRKIKQKKSLLSANERARLLNRFNLIYQKI
ncbi:hypothetical protein Phi19:2_gp057 [Cellulophaga phage phi19:2]|uniref:Uncharacterized protein n=3 Tax=Cellulophaga phage phiST TaxID=756282 RepID=M4SPT0_9CAUD|nr:hypothetical protein CGPG_00052 [Cellulophaga phage phiST]AGH56751.1 hypothetical protein CGPG_00052 [Cellulophaga phage phiST]AGO47196.1 hypothetical protein PhiST_gp057 [Cellulophaga phage phiST]AGO48692.1 hypothetical protein Phi19:2_gp057 [Cellulophaga phage phi19:2]AGO49062.1 hypothetical protein Phi13:1_gp051 [Cellulophaga phage phi13:1]